MDASEEPVPTEGDEASAPAEGQDEPATSRDTREAIMEATFRAISKHGYKDLRLRDIGEELDMTRQVIHYHYDGKYDLLSSFLEYIIAQYEGAVEVPEGADPVTELEVRVDQCLFGPEFDDFGHWDRMKVYHEIFAYAQHDERHRETFNEHYVKMRDSVVNVVQRGIDEGVFEDVDAELVGQFITDAIHVGRSRRISLGHEDAPEQAREAIRTLVIPPLLARSE